MNAFDQFNIKLNTKGFEGDKIKMSKILNRLIEVHDFKIEESKIFKNTGTGKCLHLQIVYGDSKYIVFTGSGCLMEAIQKIPQNGFPFKTTIIKDNERLLFT